MPNIHDHATPMHLTLSAPHGGYPPSLAQQGYCMMFPINNNACRQWRGGFTCTECGRFGVDTTDRARADLRHRRSNAGARLIYVKISDVG